MSLDNHAKMSNILEHFERLNKTLNPNCESDQKISDFMFGLIKRIQYLEEENRSLGHQVDMLSSC